MGSLHPQSDLLQTLAFARHCCLFIRPHLNSFHGHEPLKRPTQILPVRRRGGKTYPQTARPCRSTCCCRVAPARDGSRASSTLPTRVRRSPSRPPSSTRSAKPLALNRVFPRSPGPFEPVLRQRLGNKINGTIQRSECDVDGDFSRAYPD